MLTIAVLALAIQAPATGNEMSQATRDVLAQVMREELQDCLATQTRRLNASRALPRDIATAVVVRCADDIEAVSQVMAETRGSMAVLRLRERIEARARDKIVADVVALRAGGRRP